MLKYVRRKYCRTNVIIFGDISEIYLRNSVESIEILHFSLSSEHSQAFI